MATPIKVVKNMGKILIFILGFFGLLSFSSTAYASTLFNENFDSYDLGNLTGQGGWEVASPSGNARFSLVSGYVFSAPRALQTSRAQNQQLPIAISKDLGHIPATDLVNLAFNWRIHSTNYGQRITVVDSNNYPVCGFGQISPSTAYLDIPYSTLDADYGWTTGDGVSYGSGLTTAVWYYPIIRMDFSGRTCTLSLDNGMSWSPSNLQMYSAAATGSATLDRIVITYPETSTSPSYGAYLWELDGLVMWSGAVASPPEVGDIDLSLFSATNSGYLTYNLTGNVGYISDNLTTCEVDVFQQDINNKSPLFYNAGLGFEGTVILWNNGLTDYTQVFPNNVYIGHGYTTAIDAWQVEGFKVHYYGDQDTNLKFDYTCYEQYGTGNDVQVYHSQGVNPAAPDYDEALIATPSGLMNAPSEGGTICGTDWFCAIKEWVIYTMKWLFTPKLSSMLTNGFIDLAKTKAPFAYITAITSMDFTFPTLSTESAMPSFNIPINAGVDLPNTEPVNFVASVPEAGRPIFNIVRGFTTLLFWAVFIGFLIQTGRSLFK